MELYRFGVMEGLQLHLNGEAHRQGKEEEVEKTFIELRDPRLRLWITTGIHNGISRKYPKRARRESLSFADCKRPKRKPISSFNFGWNS